MQTFLPYENFQASAQVLDYRRLGKQRVEVLQILKALNGETKKGAWANHPASLMWKENLDALVLYGVDICEEWISRGYKDTCRGKILEYSSTPGIIPEQTSLPSWIGGIIHSTHRSNLLRKDPAYYSTLGWKESDGLEYFWPTKAQA